MKVKVGLAIEDLTNLEIATYQDMGLEILAQSTIEAPKLTQSGVKTTAK